MNNLFSAKRLALAAVFSVIAFAVSLLEFALFPATPYFKLDFSYAILLIGAYMLGPVLAEIMVIISLSLRLLLTTSGGVGELANFITANFFIVLPSVIYYFKKGLPAVFISLVLATVAEIIAAFMANRFILFPLYFGESAGVKFNAVILFVILFNLIKCVTNSLITLFLYKRLKKTLNKFL